MKCPGLLILLALASVSSQVIDLNHAIDKNLVRVRDVFRKKGFTTYPIPNGSIGSEVSYSNGIGYGLDSIVRTGDCTLQKEDYKFTYDLHLGFSFLENTFGILKINEDLMSASVRISNNSIQLSYTLDRTAGKCRVTLHVYRVERLREIFFGSSRPEYDGRDVDNFFEHSVVPSINHFLDTQRSDMEDALQDTLCRHHKFVDPTFALSILISEYGDSNGI